MELAKQLGDMARKETGLEQYAIAKFAEALEVRLHALAYSSAGSSGCSFVSAHEEVPC